MAGNAIESDIIRCRMDPNCTKGFRYSEPRILRLVGGGVYRPIELGKTSVGISRSNEVLDPKAQNQGKPTENPFKRTTVITQDKLR